MSRLKRIFLLILIGWTVAAGMSRPAVADAVIDIGGRTVTVFTPVGYDPGTPAPVVMLLHGFGQNGANQDAYMQFSALADEFGFLYLYPDGTVGSITEPIVFSSSFWNATDQCCDFANTGVDDSGYLRAVLDETQTLFNVDTTRVFVIGHSNGGFMAYRMACDHADLIAGIVSLAGATYFTPGDCTPSEPVHILQIHGTLDDTSLYSGDSPNGVPYPGAVASVETWATYDGCSLVGDTSPPPLDLDAILAGDETTVTRYATGCSTSGSAELWTIVDGGHEPVLSTSFSREVTEHLFAHPKVAAVAAVPTLAPSGWLFLGGLIFVLGWRKLARETEVS